MDMRTKVLAIAVLAATGVFVSVASGGAPMGLPTATLSQGQWAIGAEYAYEQSNLEAFGRVREVFLDNSVFSWTQPFRLDDVTSNMFFGTLAYGLCENWDIFARVGASDAQDSLVLVPADTEARQAQDDLDSSFGLAWGMGTRATFCRCGPWSFGGLAQVTWFHPGDSSFGVTDPLQPDESWAGDVSLKYWQAQMALAAAYQIDTWRLWAGPFLQFVRGDMDFAASTVLGDAGISTIRWTSDLQESSQIGAQFGARWEATKEWNLSVEGQITGDSWLVGVGVSFIPGTATDL